MITRKSEPLPAPILVKARLFDKIGVDFVTGCWIWTGAKSANGYGIATTYRPRKTNIYSHRALFIVYRGAIPDGLVLDHLCRNTTCCNPEHLEAVTPGENTRRMLAAVGHPNARKARCPLGHDYTRVQCTNGAYKRYCKICAHAANRAYHFRKHPPKPLKTTCPQGHEYTIVVRASEPKPIRVCRECRVTQNRSFRARQKVAA